MDARRCISYLTIELRGPIPGEFRESIGSHVFGCDICQDVCPWNRRAPATPRGEFQPRTFGSAENGQRENEAASALSSQQGGEYAGESSEESLFLPRLEWLADLEETEFRRIFQGSAIKRTKWRGLVRNACIALGNSEVRPGAHGYQRITEMLHRLSCSEDAVIAESALWALSRIE
jgi:epoxyqueuosine reductase